MAFSKLENFKVSECLLFLMLLENLFLIFNMKTQKSANMKMQGKIQAAVQFQLDNFKYSLHDPLEKEDTIQISDSKLWEDTIQTSDLKFCKAVPKLLRKENPISPETENMDVKKLLSCCVSPGQPSIPCSFSCPLLSLLPAHNQPCPDHTSSYPHLSKYANISKEPYCQYFLSKHTNKRRPW